MNVAMMNRLLRSPSEVAEDCREDRVPPSAAGHAIAAIVGGALLFGAAVGSSRGEVTLFTRAHEGGLAYQLYVSLARMLSGAPPAQVPGAGDAGDAGVSR